MAATTIASIRRRVDAVNADLPTVTDIDLLAVVAGADAEMLLDELVATQARVRALEAALRGAVAYDGHVFNCPAKLESAASDDCSPRCQAARAALDGEG